jgi:hypothetical protein
VTFLDLCEQTYELHNRYPQVFESVDLGKVGTDWTVPDPTQRQVIRAVQNAYTYIVNYSSHWSFLTQRGKLLNLLAGVDSYSPGMYDNPIWDTLYVLEGSYRRPVLQQLYSEWTNLQRSEQSPLGAVLYMATRPASWLVWPTPVVDCELWGEALLRADGLVSAGDEPPWEEDLHWVVVELAEMLVEMRLDSTEEAVQKLNVQVGTLANLNGLKQMLKRYTPRFEWV